MNSYLGEDNHDGDDDDILETIHKNNHKGSVRGKPTKSSLIMNRTRSNSPGNTTAPGAQRIAPTRNEQNYDETSASSIGRNAGNLEPHLIEAEIVQEEDRDIEDMLEQARAEGRKEAEQDTREIPVLEANPIDGDADKRKKRQTIAAGMTLLLIGISIAVALTRPSEPFPDTTPTVSPSQQPIPSLVQDLLLVLNTVHFWPAPLSYPATNSSTAEDKALAWLADEDPMALSLLQTDNFERLKQRFALLSFVFSNPSYPVEAIEVQEDECLWPYIQCSNETGWVTSINARGNRLLGSLPETIGLLTELRGIGLYSSKLQGTLPLSLSRLTLLESFDVSQGGLTGTFPWDSFRNMSNLVVLAIGDNSLSGALPTSLIFPKIKRALLYNNVLTGRLPSELSSWSTLELFSINSNLLTGSIPSEYSAWTNINGFYVGENNGLNGSLPASFGNWHQVDSFGVSGTSVHGEIPKTYSSWQNLTYGSFENTQLSGAMPLCEINKTISELIADCLDVSCPCCTQCCPISVGNIPQYPFCPLPQ